MLIDWDLVSKHCPNIRGIIHCGAHTGEERKLYKDIPTLWIEANKVLYEQLVIRNLDVINCAVSDHNGYADFYLTDFSASNSLLKPRLGRGKEIGKARVRCKTLRTIIEERPDVAGYNFLNLDIQGAELLALSGCDLDQFDYIYTEVHVVETYKNCARLAQIDLVLSDYTRVIDKITKHGQGDALYVRK